MRSVGIIGLGHVGRLLATQLVSQSSVDQLILVDQSDAVAVGMQTELADLSAVSCQTVEVKVQDWAAVANCEIVVTAFGKSALQLESPTAELSYNQAAAAQIAKQLHDYHFNGILLNIADPNEAITAYLQAKIGLPHQHAIGVGTCLDTVHLRRAVAAATQISVNSISGFVYGQHNGQQVFAWSTVRVNGQGLDQSLNGHHLDLNKSKVNADLSNWYTLHGLHYNAAGIVGVTCRIIKAVMGNQNLALPVAIFQPQYQTYVSFPTLINRQGQGNPLLLKLYPVEENAVKVAAEAIQSQINALYQIEGEKDD